MGMSTKLGPVRDENANSSRLDLINQNLKDSADSLTSGRGFLSASKNRLAALKKPAWPWTKTDENESEPLNQSETFHVDPSDRHLRRYRSMKPVFESNWNEFEDDLENSNEKFEWSTVSKQPEIAHHFIGQEVTQDKGLVPCYVTLSRTHLSLYHQVDFCSKFIRITAKYPFKTVLRVSGKRDYPECLTFWFGRPGQDGEEVSSVHKLLIPDFDELTTAVKRASQRKERWLI